MVVVPRALEHSEIKENIDIFDFKLTVNEMEKISELRNNNLRIVDPEVRRPVWDEV
jgi:diketogulonate reductase-like aldo/keto reductase